MTDKPQTNMTRRTFLAVSAALIATGPAGLTQERLQAEQYYLGAILKRVTGAAGTAKWLEPSYFMHPIHRDIFKALTTALSANKTFLSTEVCRELGSKVAPSYIYRLMDIAHDPQWATLQGPREAFMLKCESRDKLTDALFVIVPEHSENYEALPEIIDGEWEADRSETDRLFRLNPQRWLRHER